MGGTNISKRSQTDITTKFKDANIVNNSVNAYYKKMLYANKKLFRFWLIDEITVLVTLTKIKNMHGLSINLTNMSLLFQRSKISKMISDQ